MLGGDRERRKVFCERALCTEGQPELQYGYYFAGLFLAELSKQNLLRRPTLVKHLRKDGLHRFFILKCMNCHEFIAVDVSAVNSINHTSLKVRGLAEINKRSTLAVHCTSLSGRISGSIEVCQILMSQQTMSRHNLKLFADASQSVVQRTMELEGKRVFSSSTTNSTSAPEIRKCTVSFDAS